MHTSVILIHNLPDGSSHFDWLVDRPELQSEHRLLAFRCQHRPDSTDHSDFQAIKLPNHRAIYLTYEGQISNNRGTVQRLEAGKVVHLEQTPHSINILINWPNQTIAYRATLDPQNTTLWNFHQHAPNSPLDA